MAGLNRSRSGPRRPSCRLWGGRPPKGSGILKCLTPSTCRVRLRYSRVDRGEDDILPSVTIHDRTSTGDPTGTITLPDVPDGITLRQLIRTRVREEVARANLGSWLVFLGLVKPADPARKQIDWEVQADTAIDQFLANGYIVLVNGSQVLDLETRIDLRKDPEVWFIRLTPLEGA
jgi:hypothetical protein